MDMTGEYRIAAPRETVWRALNDPEMLKQCIPGCEELQKTSPTEFTAKVVAKVGPVKATFTGVVKLSDLDPPKGYKISGEGKGGAAGFAKGGAEVNLEEVDANTTILHYKAQANVGGKLAQIGSRLIEGTAKKMSDDFFGGFARLLGTGSEAAAPAEAAPPMAAATAMAASSPMAATTMAATPELAAAPPVTTGRPRAGLPPTVWIGGVVLIVVILLIVFAF
jgi:hypothetical protein